MPSLSLAHQMAQLVFWQTAADLQVKPPEFTTIGGVWWQGGRAADALLLTEDWQASSPIPLLFAAPAQALPQGGTEFPPFLSLDYQRSLEPVAHLARWLSHEARTMGIPLLVLPPAAAWSRDPERGQEMIHCWQHSVSDQWVLLAEEVMESGDPPTPEQLAQGLQRGVKALVTSDPQGMVERLTAAVQQGLIAVEQIEGIAQFWLGLKKRLFPHSPVLANLPGDPMPSLQNLLADAPLPSTWSKVSTLRHPWQQWRSPEALALAEHLRLGAIEIHLFSQPLNPDFTWIWTATLPTPATPALALPIAYGIPYLISHPWRDPQDISASSGARILLQWFAEMTPPPLFWHWLSENAQRLCGVIGYGHLQDPPELLACCRQHNIPYARSLSAHPSVQTHLLRTWIPGDKP